MKQQSNKTALKCKFSNEVHKMLEPQIDLPAFKRRSQTKFTEKRKVELFDQIYALHIETSNAIRAINADKRNKKQVQKLRAERGYVPKKKTSKEEYQKLLAKEPVTA